MNIIYKCKLCTYQSEKVREFGFHIRKEHNYTNEVYFNKYMKEIGEGYFFGICVKGIKESLEKCKESELDNVDIEELQSQINRVNKIVTDIIKTDRDSIIKKMNELIKLKEKK